MKAIDTNLLVRFILRDDPFQSSVAVAQVAEGVFVSDGVLIETEWVLRSTGWKRARINQALDSFLALDEVAVTQAESLAWALKQHLHGADWADMLHLVAARNHDAFLTFDLNLADDAGADPPVPVITLRDS